MRLKTRVVVAGGIFVAGLATHVAAQDNTGFLPYQDEAATERGAEIYVENCASCHGETLKGEQNWREPGEDGLAKAPPHDATGHTWHHADMVLFRTTKYGTAALVGNGYKSRMPGFEDVLTDAEIVEVLAFIKSTWSQRVIDMHNARNG